MIFVIKLWWYQCIANQCKNNNKKLLKSFGWGEMAKILSIMATTKTIVLLFNKNINISQHLLIKFMWNIKMWVQYITFDALPTPWRTQMWVQVKDSGRRRSRDALPSSQHLRVRGPLVLGPATGNMDTQDSPRPGLGGSHHLPPYSIFCTSPQGPHPNGFLSRDSQVGGPKFP